jgi:hypothetical protein
MLSFVLNLKWSIFPIALAKRTWVKRMKKGEEAKRITDGYEKSVQQLNNECFC